MIRIVGCARSGTLYTTKVLKACKLNVGHEYTDTDGTVSAFAITPPPYPLMKWEPPLGKVAHQGEDCTKIDWSVTLHQVRDPLKVIASCAVVIPSVAWKYYERVLMMPKRTNKVYRCMMYWHRWNVLCERASSMTYRLENIQSEWRTICKKIGISEFTPFPIEINTTTNHNKRNQIPFVDKNFAIDSFDTLYDIDAVLAEKIKQQAIRYGYKY